MPEHSPFRHQIVSEFTWHKVKVSSMVWSGCCEICEICGFVGLLKCGLGGTEKSKFKSGAMQLSVHVNLELI